MLFILTIKNVRGDDANGTRGFVLPDMPWRRRGAGGVVDPERRPLGAVPGGAFGGAVSGRLYMTHGSGVTKAATLKASVLDSPDGAVEGSTLAERTGFGAAAAAFDMDAVFALVIKISTAESGATPDLVITMADASGIGGVWEAVVEWDGGVRE